MDPVFSMADPATVEWALTFCMVGLPVWLGLTLGQWAIDRAMARQSAQLAALCRELGLRRTQFGHAAGVVDGVQVEATLTHPVEEPPRAGSYYAAAVLAVGFVCLITAPMAMSEGVSTAREYWRVFAAIGSWGTTAYVAWTAFARMSLGAVTSVRLEAVVNQVPELTVRPRDARSSRGLTSGDAEFDAAFVVSGDEVEAVAHLGPDQRLALRQVDGRTVHLEDGVAYAALHPRDAEAVARMRSLVGLARGVGREEPASALLVERVRTEVGNARVRALAALVLSGGDTAAHTVCEILVEHGLDVHDPDELAAYLGRSELLTMAILHRMRDVGTVNQFPALDELSEIWESPVAITRAAILARVAPETAGGLTLTEAFDPRGALTPVGEHRGELSLVGSGEPV